MLVPCPPALISNFAFDTDIKNYWHVLNLFGDACNRVKCAQSPHCPSNQCSCCGHYFAQKKAEGQTMVGWLCRARTVNERETPIRIMTNGLLTMKIVKRSLLVAYQIIRFPTGGRDCFGHMLNRNRKPKLMSNFSLGPFENFNNHHQLGIVPLTAASCSGL